MFYSSSTPSLVLPCFQGKKAVSNANLYSITSFKSDSEIYWGLDYKTTTPLIHNCKSNAIFQFNWYLHPIFAYLIVSIGYTLRIPTQYSLSWTSNLLLFWLTVLVNSITRKTSWNSGFLLILVSSSNLLWLSSFHLNTYKKASVSRHARDQILRSLTITLPLHSHGYCYG